MHVGIVGAGPAGSFLSSILASKGAAVKVFDPTHPREKPCGGGMSPGGFSRFDFLDSTALLRRKANCVTCISPGGAEVELTLDAPIRIFSRLQLDRHILDIALQAGAECIQSRVTDVERKDGGWVIHTSKGTHTCDFLVGADGAHSLVRRKLIGKTPPESLLVAAGYLVGTAVSDNIVLKFVPGLQGYAWAFPRTDATSLGICGPATQNRAKDLRLVLDEFVQEKFPGFRPEPTEAYRATLFIGSTGRSGPICGQNWALIGDAAGFPDPITFEGIQYALESARLLATALVDDKPERYASVCKDAFLSEHMVGAQLARYVYRHELLEKAIRAARHNPDARAVLADICSATVSYRTLRRRLIGVLGRRLISKIFR